MLSLQVKQNSDSCPFLVSVFRSFRPNNQQEKSPFNLTTLDAWLDNAEREINIIMSCLDIMEGIQKSLDREALAAGVVDLFCFVFTSVETDDDFLDQMTNYLSKDQTNPPPSVSPPSKDQWFLSDEVVANMRKKARDFISAAKQPQVWFPGSCSAKQRVHQSNHLPVPGWDSENPRLLRA